MALKDRKVLLKRLVKWDLLKSELKLEDMVKKGDTRGVGQQGPIGPRGSAGPRGVQGAKGLRGIVGIHGPLGVQWPVGGQADRGPKGDKGDRGAPAVEIVIVSELCKHLPIALVEQYRRVAYARYAINSMKDIELHGAVRVKTIIDKGGRCNASQSDVTRMATLSKSQVNSNYVLDFDNDESNMEMVHTTFTIFMCFWYTKLRLMQKLCIGERTQLCNQ